LRLQRKESTVRMAAPEVHVQGPGANPPPLAPGRVGTRRLNERHAWHDFRSSYTAGGAKALGRARMTDWTMLLMAVALVSGGCVHTQQTEQKVYVISEDASGVGSNLESGTGGAGAEAYCAEIQKQCFKKCWRRKPKPPSIEKGSGVHHAYCTTVCLEEFNKCIKEQEELERQETQKRELHFPSMDAALAWLREHKSEVAIGTVVIVGGVIAAPYVIAIMGGSLVLVSL